MSDRTRTIIGIVVSIIAVGGCVWWASNQETPELPSGGQDIGLLVGGLLLYAGATVLRGMRWDAILRYLQIRHDPVDAHALTTVGYMGNTVLPARGGELLRIFLLAERSHAKRREVLGSILTERLLDASALAFLFVVVAVVDGSVVPGGGVAIAAAGVGFALALAAPVVYLRLRVSGRLGAFAEKVRPITRASRQLLSARGALLFAGTLAIWVTEGAIFWLVARSLDTGLDLVPSVAVVVVASLSALIPAAPGYVGTYDAAALVVLHAAGVNGGAAVGCVLLFRCVVFIPITVIGLIVMVGRYGGLRSTLRRSRAAEAEAEAVA